LLSPSWSNQRVSVKDVSRHFVKYVMGLDTFFLRRGGWRCCVCYLILLWTRDQTRVAPAFPTPALRKKREGTGHPRCW
jgi:hypothetical protein